MVGNYTVWLGKEPVGQVTVEQQGLYYCFHCQCQLHSEVMYKVNVACGGNHASLGILVPSGKDYQLTKRLPVKQFPSDKPEFWITPKLSQKQTISLDIYPEEPFRYITRLEKAYLERNRGVLKIIINDPALR